MLTPKQEKFVQNIIQGMNQADAYRSAYSTKNMTDNSIYVNASKLAADAKVALRIKELRDELAKPSIKTAQERLEWLSQLIDNEEEGTNEKLRAIDIMNKMQGEYVQKVEAEVKNAVNINIELVED
jgi:phage terminase small subunit